jgi:hypothetical protein
MTEVQGSAGLMPHVKTASPPAARLVVIATQNLNLICWVTPVASQELVVGEDESICA